MVIWLHDISRFPELYMIAYLMKSDDKRHMLYLYTVLAIPNITLFSLSSARMLS